MDYQKVNYIIKHIEDTTIPDAVKYTALRTIRTGNIDYLSRSDLQRAINWLLLDHDFNSAMDLLALQHDN